MPCSEFYAQNEVVLEVDCLFHLGDVVNRLVLFFIFSCIELEYTKKQLLAVNTTQDIVTARFAYIKCSVVVLDAYHAYVN